MSTPAPSIGAPPNLVAPGIYQVPLPVEGPLKAVNCYIAVDEDGWDLVDTGFHNPATEAAWRQALAQLGLSLDRLRRIYVTHYHPDHFGCAGWLQGESGAPVYMLDREAEIVAAFWQDPAMNAQAMADAFVRYGMPAEIAARIVQVQNENATMVLPLPKITTMRDGDVVQFGAYRCRVVWTPGHAEGMYMLWAESEGILLSADHILPKITPNISYWPHLVGSDPRFALDPLGTFLAHVKKTAAFSTRLVLPGHRWVFTDVTTRCQELVRHHDERLAKTLSLVPPGQPRTAWEVSCDLFGTHWEPPQLRFAMAETLAHLEHLRLTEHVSMVQGNSGPLWQFAKHILR